MGMEIVHVYCLILASSFEVAPTLRRGPKARFISGGFRLLANHTEKVLAGSMRVEDEI